MRSPNVHSPDTRIPEKADPGIGEVKHISFPEFSAVDKGYQVTLSGSLSPWVNYGLLRMCRPS
ncbi:hypothetical protein AS19_16580 [Alcanivorax sp. NBRC 101098]|nr:hypothetical protein AS19_16580 [Alcanivorax sp. NBRC 101098]